ncbi:unnamed protein product [Prorocentrum cordatum]|nr:unnamed protein product [Polarella glacialis]
MQQGTRRPRGTPVRTRGEAEQAAETLLALPDFARHQFSWQEGGDLQSQDAPEAQGIFDAVAADAEPVCFEGQLKHITYRQPSTHSTNPAWGTRSIQGKTISG